MSARATCRSTKQGDLVFTDDPEAITRKKGRVHYTPATNQTTRHPETAEAELPTNNDQDTSTEDGDFMDASEIVVQTEAGYNPELIPESDSSSDSKSTKSNNSEARELNRQRTHNESPDDIRDFTPQPDRPRLPSGEWYMPDLNNTSLSTVMEFRSHMESGRYLFQFPKLEPYTEFDLFIIDPHTGQIEMYDDDKDITYPFSVKASRKKRNNSQVIELIKEAVRDKRRASSTPNPASNSPRLPPTPRSNRHVSNNNANLSMLEHNQTILTELLVKNQQKENEAGLIKDRKDRLRRIKCFDGNNKSDCITWVDQTESVAKELSISLRRAMMETAEGSVYNVLSSLGRVSDKDLVDHMLEAFSTIPTQEDAIDCTIHCNTHQSEHLSTLSTLLNELYCVL